MLNAVESIQASWSVLRQRPARLSFKLATILLIGGTVGLPSMFLFVAGVWVVVRL